MHSHAQRALALAMSIAGPALAVIALVVDTGKRW
jgi:hypothetical protein